MTGCCGETRGARRRGLPGFVAVVLPVLLGMLSSLAPTALAQDLAVRGGRVHTMGPAGTIPDGVVVVRDGKIAAVGPRATTPIPEGLKVLEAAEVTPGLIDARCTLGLSGLLNTRHDSDQLERSAPIQPELRALDAYNPLDPLVAYVRSFGVTTVQTGHAPGETVSGQLMIVKLRGVTAEQAVLREVSGVAVTLSPQAHREGARGPGTRGKLMAILRQELLRAREYAERHRRAGQGAGEAAGAAAPETPSGAAGAPPARDLRLETLARVLDRQLPLVITAHRAQDIAGVLRLKAEFGVDVILDGGAEAYSLLAELRQAGVPVLLHPTMMRAVGETENASFTTASRLVGAGIPTAIQSGYESYVPKARVVLLEAAIAAANGLSFEQALAAVTITPARILGIDARVGSIEVGKDADLAGYSGDPFEYLTRCLWVVIDGRVVSDQPR